jgi:hypothetical protein
VKLTIYHHLVPRSRIVELPTVAAQVRTQVRSYGICGGQSGTGTGFLRTFWFLLPNIPPIVPHSSSSVIIRGWYSRPVVTSVLVDSVPLYPKKGEKSRAIPPLLIYLHGVVVNELRSGKFFTFLHFLLCTRYGNVYRKNFVVFCFGPPSGHMNKFLKQKFCNEFLWGPKPRTTPLATAVSNSLNWAQIYSLQRNTSVNLTLLVISFVVVFAVQHSPTGKFLPFRSPKFSPI